METMGTAYQKSTGVHYPPRWPQHTTHHHHHHHHHSFHSLLLLTILFTAISSIQAMASNSYISGIKLSGNRIEDQTFYGEIKSMIGGRAELPCNLTLPSPDDAIQLIFWYRGNSSRVPLYSVDSRVSALANATHFHSDIYTPRRATFELTTKPSALLIIDPVLEDDHGDYRCRVDFRWGRTINSFVSLHVIVPPKRITIRDQNGNYVHNSTIGPYNQNSDVILTCESNGGIPPPILQWYKNGVMIDGSYVVADTGLVSNELTIYKLSPNDLYDKFICQAGNFNNTNPIEAFVVLDINLLPVDVRIVAGNKSRELIAGRKIDLRCETHGSKPVAIIKWYKNNQPLSYSTELYESNRTESSITLMPTVNDNNALLQCRALNPKLLDHFVEDVWKLKVLFSPQITLSARLGNDEPSDPTTPANTLVVNEKSQVLIECHIAANPPLVDVHFVHNSTTVHSLAKFDTEKKSIARFVITEVYSSHRGRYQCVVSNREGLSRSNQLQLDVRYVPFCRKFVDKQDDGGKSNEYISHALAANESIQLTCDVDANPIPTDFYWTLNSDTLDDNFILAQSNNGNHILRYKAKTDHDYGEVRCWSRNQIGLQRNPCLYVISKAGPPANLVSCTVTNKTTTSLTVECFPGDSGGSPQLFHAHVYESEAGGEESLIDDDDDDLEDEASLAKSELNLTSKTSPIFYLNSLSPGTSYIIELYASNARGQSKISRLSVTTLFTKNTKLISSSLQEIEYDPIFSLFIGALFTILLVVIAAYITCRFRQKQIHTKRNRQKEEQIKQNFAFRPACSPGKVPQDKQAAASFIDEKPSDIVSFEAEVSNSNSKLNLYVIKETKDEPIQLSNVLRKPSSTSSPPVAGLAPPSSSSSSMASTIQLTSPVLFGANEFTSSGSSSLIPLTAMSTTDSTLYPQATFLTKDLVSEIATTGSPYGGAPIDCLSNNYFLAPPGDAILYTSTAALQPQILSINDKIDGILLNNHFGYYHSTNVPPNSIDETFVLHHQPQPPLPQQIIAANTTQMVQQPSPQPDSEPMCDYSIHQTIV